MMVRKRLEVGVILYGTMSMLFRVELAIGFPYRWLPICTQNTTLLNMHVAPIRDWLHIRVSVHRKFYCIEE